MNSYPEVKPPQEKNEIVIYNEKRLDQRIAWENVIPAVVGESLEHQPQIMNQLLEMLLIGDQTAVNFTMVHCDPNNGQSYKVSGRPNLEILNSHADRGFSVYYQPTQRIPKKGNFTGNYPLFVEGDVGTYAEQLLKWSRTGIRVASFIGTSGNRSVHSIFIVKCVDVAHSVLEELQANLTRLCGGDERAVGLGRCWRYLGTTNPKSGKQSKMLHCSGNIFSVEELLENCPSLGARLFAKPLPWNTKQTAKYIYTDMNGGFKSMNAFNRFKQLQEEGSVECIQDRVDSSLFRIDEGVDIWVSKRGVVAPISGCKMSFKEVCKFASLKGSRPSNKLQGDILRPDLPGMQVQTTKYIELDTEAVKKAKFIIVNANMGSGKSFAQEKVIKENDWAQHSIITSVYKAIVKKASTDYGTDYYEDRKHTADLDNGLAICLQSIMQVQNVGKKFILIIEEVDIFMNALLGNNDTLKGFDLVNVGNVVKKLLKSADKVFANSANVFPEFIDFFMFYMNISQEECYIVRNTAVVKKKGFNLKGFSKGNVVDRIIAEAILGEKAFISCTSKNTAISIAERLEAEGKKVLCIHGDNSGWKEPVFFVAHPVESIIQNQWDYIVASPSVSIGTSIDDVPEIKGYFNSVYILIEGNTINPLSVSQGMNRVRDAEVPRYIWYNHANQRTFNTSPQEIIDKAVRKIGKTTINSDGDYTPQIFGILANLELMEGKVYQDERDYQWLHTAGIFFSRMNILRNDFFNYFQKSIALEGYEVEDIILPEKDRPTQTDKTLRADSISRKIFSFEKIAAADLVTEDKYEEIRKGGAKDATEQCQVEKYIFSKKYPGVELTVELIERDRPLFKGLQNVLFATNEIYADTKEAKEFEFADLKNLYGLESKKKRAEVVNTLGLLRLQGMRGFLDTDVTQDILDKAWKIKGMVKTHLGVELKKGKTANRIVKELAECVNVYVKSEPRAIEGSRKKERCLRVIEALNVLPRLILEAKLKHWENTDNSYKLSKLETPLETNKLYYYLDSKGDIVDGYEVLRVATGNDTDGGMVISNQKQLNKTFTAVVIKEVATGKTKVACCKDIALSAASLEDVGYYTSEGHYVPF